MEDTKELRRAMPAHLALVELGMVLWAWIAGEEDLPGLLIAWLEVVSGMWSVDHPPTGPRARLS